MVPHGARPCGPPTGSGLAFHRRRQLRDYSPKSKVKMELPAAIATTWRPAHVNVIGFARMIPPMFCRHSSLPLSASSAKKYPSSLPPNTSFPPVESTPAHGLVCSLYSQTLAPVAGSKARMAPCPGSSGRSTSGTLPM